MEVTFSATIPDDVAAEIQNGSHVSLARRLLELATIKLYEADRITSRQVQEMLGLKSREELFEFFKQNDVPSKVTRADLERERAMAVALFDE